jgi:hypothetical protein
MFFANPKNRRLPDNSTLYVNDLDEESDYEDGNEEEVDAEEKEQEKGLASQPELRAQRSGEPTSQLFRRL